jgi:two-component system OmpR family sensor kinase
MKLTPKVILLVLVVLLISMSMLSIPLYWYTRVALEDSLGDQLIRMSHVIGQNLDQEVLQTLSREPELGRLRQQFETNLEKFSTEGIVGITLYRRDGTILAQDRQTKKDLARLSQALPGLLTLGSDGQASVSEIYQMANGSYVKAVALPVITGPEQDAILVIWAGANYMAVIKQLQGSLLWIFLAAILVAIAMTFIFSRSLIRPVRALSRYAGAIQSNLNSTPVDLQRSDEFGDLNHSLIKMHEEIRKQEETARQLLAGIAHEIKNPLGGMEIYAGLLKDELAQLPDEKAGETGPYLERIRAELHHLNRIVQEYLDYARPLKSVIETVRIQEVFDDIKALLAPEMDSLDQALRLQGDALLRTDRSKLHRVFLNLVQNGLTAAGSGGEIQIEVIEQKTSIELSFKDNGPGIPKADRERIFEPYFSTTDRGYGLGLSIVQSILTELGGTILVQKSDASGTVFVATLPKKEMNSA